MECQVSWYDDPLQAPAGALDRVAWNTGGRYNPKTDTWKPISTTGEPEARAEPLFVWTGKELLVWGGITPYNLP